MFQVKARMGTLTNQMFDDLKVYRQGLACDYVAKPATETDHFLEAGIGHVKTMTVSVRLFTV